MGGCSLIRVCSLIRSNTVDAVCCLLSVWDVLTTDALSDLCCRTESVVEKFLANWMSLCMYDHIKVTTHFIWVQVVVGRGTYNTTISNKIDVTYYIYKYFFHLFSPTRHSPTGH